MRERFRGGAATITEILDRERDYSRVQRELLRSRFNYLLSIAQLKQWSGLISREDVEYIDSLLDRRQPPISERSS